MRLRNRPMLLSLVALSTCASSMAVTITVTNPTDDNWIEAPVNVAVKPDWGRISESPLDERWVLTGPETLPVQRDDLDHDGTVDEIAFLVTLRSHESKTLTLERGRGSAPPIRAHALMSLKGFDGPGWESEVIAYRIYWNLDNAMDIFGKTRPILSLDHWAQPGVAHSIEDQHGIDVLKVGRGIGIGGFGIWRGGKIEKVTNVMKDYHIRADGPIRAIVDLEYVYWQVGQRDPDVKPPPGSKIDKYDMLVRMSIFAGQYWGQAQVTIQPAGGSPMPELVTGIPLHDETELIQDKDTGILGRWGKQALGDKEVPKSANLGIGVIVDPNQIVAFGEDAANSYVRLKPDKGRVVYRYHGSWQKEPNAARSTKEYEAKLRAVAKRRPEVTVQVEN